MRWTVLEHFADSEFLTTKGGCRSSATSGFVAFLLNSLLRQGAQCLFVGILPHVATTANHLGPVTIRHQQVRLGCIPSYFHSVGRHLSDYSLRFAGLRVHACSRASSIRCSEWNPVGKIGHDQISGESRATYFSVASRAGATVTFSGGGAVSTHHYPP